MNISLYDLTGFVSAVLVLVSLTGIALQLRFVWRRKGLFRAGELGDETPTSILSLNRFSTSFIAFFSMFLYAMTMEAVNVYIALPRAVAIGLLLLIIVIPNNISH